MKTNIYSIPPSIPSDIFISFVQFYSWARMCINEKRRRRKRETAQFIHKNRNRKREKEREKGRKTQTLKPKKEAHFAVDTHILTLIQAHKHMHILRLFFFYYYFKVIVKSFYECIILYIDIKLSMLIVLCAFVML